MNLAILLLAVLIALEVGVPAGWVLLAVLVAVVERLWATYGRDLRRE